LCEWNPSSQSESVISTALSEEQGTEIPKVLNLMSSQVVLERPFAVELAFPEERMGDLLSSRPDPFQEFAVSNQLPHSFSDGELNGLRTEAPRISLRKSQRSEMIRTRRVPGKEEDGALMNAIRVFPPYCQSESPRSVSQAYHPVSLVGHLLAEFG
jgi:hypothetical protein